MTALFNSTSSAFRWFFSCNSLFLYLRHGIVVRLAHFACIYRSIARLIVAVVTVVVLVVVVVVVVVAAQWLTGRRVGGWVDVPLRAYRPALLPSQP